MRLGWTKNKNSTTYRAVKTIRVDGKNKTLPIKTFGSDRFICETYGVTDAKAWAKEQVRLMNEAEKEDSASYSIDLSANADLVLGKQQLFNGGYLFLQDIYYELGLDKISRAISHRYPFKYDLNNILSRLIFTRILYPSSKKSSFEDSKMFIEQPIFELHDVYRALSVIAKESDYIQSRLFKNSSSLAERKTGVIYYDCTNFYFEIEQPEDDKQYGACKENRPLPIVEMGLFMDMDGIPIAFSISPGNTNEQTTLIPLEKKMLEQFDMSKFVVCTDAGLSSATNRYFNSYDENDDQPTEISSGGITRSYAYDSYGYPTSRMAAKGTTVIQNFSYKIDPLTGNLVSRKDETRNLTENFGYDDINRLTDYAGGTAEYDDKGNVLSRSDVGSFEYGQASKPYAMTGVNLSKNVIPTVGQDAIYTSFNRLSSIEENDMKAQFVYNGDYDRVKMEVSRNGGVASSHYYIGDCYELQQTGSGSIERLYLAGDYYDSPMVYVKEGSSWKLCNVLRDNLGSITHVTDYEGNLLQELSYDAWGRLRNPETQVVYAYGEEPTLYLGRGYTGHEHLTDFGLVNMNARLYDPATSRFLSPDPYVQTPEQSQNFNRYSYCMNNPLKYTDKNGKFFFLIDGLIDLISNPIRHGLNFSQYSFQRTYNSLKIDWGLFQGNFKQILSRFTWESIQTGIGYSYSQIKNAVNDISDVEYFDGATYLVRKIEPDKKGNGVTIGSFININTPKGTPRDKNGNFAPYKDDLFMHEYGHYLQSQDYGFGYLFSAGIPSLIYTKKYDGKNVTVFEDNLKDYTTVGRVKTMWFERRANKKAAKYFKDKYGVNSWNYGRYPIDVKW